MHCMYCGKVLHGAFLSARCDQCGQNHAVCRGCRKAPMAIRGTVPSVTLHVKKCPPPIIPKEGKPK